MHTVAILLLGALTLGLLIAAPFFFWLTIPGALVVLVIINEIFQGR